MRTMTAAAIAKAAAGACVAGMSASVVRLSAYFAELGGRVSADNKDAEIPDRCEFVVTDQSEYAPIPSCALVGCGYAGEGTPILDVSRSYAPAVGREGAERADAAVRRAMERTGHGFLDLAGWLDLCPQDEAVGWILWSAWCSAQRALCSYPYGIVRNGRFARMMASVCRGAVGADELRGVGAGIVRDAGPVPPGRVSDPMYADYMGRRADGWERDLFGVCMAAVRLPVLWGVPCRGADSRMLEDRTADTLRAVLVGGLCVDDAASAYMPDFPKV